MSGATWTAQARIKQDRLDIREVQQLKATGVLH